MHTVLTPADRLEEGGGAGKPLGEVPLRLREPAGG